MCIPESLNSAWFPSDSLLKPLSRQSAVVLKSLIRTFEAGKRCEPVHPRVLLLESVPISTTHVCSFRAPISMRAYRHPLLCVSAGTRNPWRKDLEKRERESERADTTTHCNSSPGRMTCPHVLIGVLHVRRARGMARRHCMPGSRCAGSLLGMSAAYRGFCGLSCLRVTGFSEFPPCNGSPGC